MLISSVYAIEDIKYDLNKDGRISITDFREFKKGIESGYDGLVDVNLDREVNLKDFMAVAKRIGKPVETKAFSGDKMWFEDNNMGMAGGLVSDFKYQFNKNKLDEWDEARNYINVYYIRKSSYKKQPDIFTDNFIKYKMAPVLNQNNIKVAINSGTPTWMALKTPNVIESSINSDIEAIRKLKELGLDVKYVGMQSTIAKSPPERMTDEEYTIEMRVNDCVRYTKAIQEEFPEIEVGLIDASPCHYILTPVKWQDKYTLLYDEFEANNLELAFLHIDCSWKYLEGNWAKMKQAEKFMKETYGWKVGKTYTFAEPSSNKNYCKIIKSFYDRHNVNTGIEIDHYVMTSWFPYPDKNLPEDSTTDCPNMKLVKEIGERIREDMDSLE